MPFVNINRISVRYITGGRPAKKPSSGIMCQKSLIFDRCVAAAPSSCIVGSIHESSDVIPSVAEESVFFFGDGSFDSLCNQGMIATGNHWYFDSLRGAPRSG